MVHILNNDAIKLFSFKCDIILRHIIKAIEEIDDDVDDEIEEFKILIGTTVVGVNNGCAVGGIV